MSATRAPDLATPLTARTTAATPVTSSDAAARAWWTSPLVILLAAAAVRLLALLTLEGDIHDGTTRVGMAAEWFFDGRPMFGRTVWPEGNYLLPGIALSIWNDPYWSPRVLFALVGLTNVWLVQRLARRVVDARAGAVAGWIVALMPFHVVQSVNGATSEMPYISFMALSLLAVLAWRERQTAWAAVAAGLALTLATTFRMDGVTWGIPLAASFVLLRERGRPFTLDGRTVVHLGLFGVSGLLYPMALFARWAQLYDSPFYQLDQAKLNTLQFFAGGHLRWPAWLYQSYVVGFWPASTFVLLTPVVALLAWLGLAVAVRRDARRAAPLAFCIVFVMLWLSYAAFTHTILAQWRYGLVTAVLLAVFVAPGARALQARWPRLGMAAIGGAVALGALAIQAVITDATFRDRGVLTRQLGLLSPVRPAQFSTRGLLDWARAEVPDSSRPLVLTPHVVDAPYLAINRAALERDGRMVVQSYYLPRSQLVHTRASLNADLHEKLARAGWVATSRSLRELGLRDGLVREQVVPTGTGDTLSWEGVRLTHVRDWGNVALWRVVR